MEPDKAPEDVTPTGSQPHPAEEESGDTDTHAVLSAAVRPLSPHEAATRTAEKAALTRSDLEAEMKKDLRQWGVGLLIVGAVSLVLHEFLSIEWGILIAILGIVTLCVRKRAMFIVIGCSLFLAAGWNILGGILALIGGEVSAGWAIFGGLQIYWGVKEIGKHAKYAPLDEPPPPELPAAPDSHPPFGS